MRRPALSVVTTLAARLRAIAQASLIAAALLVGAPLRAQDAATEEAKVQFRAATDAFKAGAYDEALRGYQRAYALKPLPALLFNIGQCFYNMGRYEEAREAYRRFLASDAADPAKRAAVEQMLADVERRIGDARAKAPGPADAPTPTPPPLIASPSPTSEPADEPAPPPVDDPPAVASSTVDPAPAPPEDDGSPWLVPVLAGGAIALGAVVIGAVGVGVWVATPAPVVLPTGSVGTLDRRSGP